MKNKINIFSNKKIKTFLIELLSNYELFFMKLNELEKNIENTSTNIIFLNETQDAKSIDFKKLSDNFLIFSNHKNKKLNKKKPITKNPYINR